MVDVEARDVAFVISIGVKPGCNLVGPRAGLGFQLDMDPPYALRVNSSYARQALKPSAISASFRLRPMKMSLLVRFSCGFHARWRSPSRSICTP